MNGGQKMMCLVWLLTWWILKVLKSKPSFTWITRQKIVKNVVPWLRLEKFIAFRMDNVRGITLRSRDSNLCSIWRPNNCGASNSFVEERTKLYRQKSEFSLYFNIGSFQFHSLSKTMIQVKISKLMCMGSCKVWKSANMKAKLKIPSSNDKMNPLKSKSLKRTQLLSKSQLKRDKQYPKFHHKVIQNCIWMDF